MRESVKKFAEEMDHQLDLHADQYGGDVTWSNTNPVRLHLGIEIQFKRFEKAVNARKYNRAMEHLVHIGNYCMMLRDVLEEGQRR